MMMMVMHFIRWQHLNARNSIEGFFLCAFAHNKFGKKEWFFVVVTIFLDHI